MNTKNELPPIKNKEIIDYVTQSTNSFYFYLRLKKPLKLIEPTRNYLDNSLLLTKLQKAKLKALQMRMKQLQRENKRKYNYASRYINKYKNMMPLKIWNKCQSTYNECKHELNSLNIRPNNIINNPNIEIKNNLYKNISKNLSMKNLGISRNIRLKHKFENQGLNKYIENVEKSNINNIH